MKRANPYTTLRDECAVWISRALNRRRTIMWRYPKGRLGERWTLTDLYERVAAAKQLGYSVELEAADDGLNVWYVKKLDESTIPWAARS